MTASPEERPCAYCGLPLGSDEGTYCCYGCRFAASVSEAQGEEGAAQRALMRLGLAIFFTMNVMVFTLALWTEDVYGADSVSSAQAVSWTELFRWASLLFAAPVLVLVGFPLVENVLENPRRWASANDSLIIVGVIAAFVYSVASLMTGGRHAYFEVACTVLVGVTLGRWLEATGRQRASAALRALEKLLPQTVRCLGTVDVDAPFVKLSELTVAKEREILLNAVAVGDVLRFLPGERIAVDGRIVRGQAAVDQQVVTGESSPSIKESGDEVFAGTLNLDGELWVVVEQPPEAGTLRKMIEAVEQAALAKSRWQSAANRLTARFVPAVAVLAILAFAGHGYYHGLGAGLMAGLAVLLIACPCALAIATPMAVHAALGAAARRGVLFRSGDALERMASVRAICFDKTGTLTTGEPTVAAFHVAEESAMTSALAVAYQLASSSTHSLSAAIKAYAQAAAADAPPLDAPRAVAGRGMQGLAPQLGATAYLGNAPYMVEAGLAMPATLAAHAAEATVAGLPLTFIGWQGQVRGMFVFREQLREQTAAVLATLADQSIAAAVLTGDHAAAALAPLQPDARSGAALKIVTRLLPEGKRDLLRQMREEHGPVAMVGDGINDAPALAAADVGIAMGCGADVSRESADVCLLGNDLAQIPWSLALARRTLTTIRQNLFWAYIYNIVGIGLALTGHLNPIWAAVAMIGSSLFVITNSLRLAGRADDLRSSLVELNPDGDLREPNAAAGTAAQSQ